MADDDREFEEPGDELEDYEYPDETDESDDSDTRSCPHCGADVYDDAEQCPHCGQWLDAETDTPIDADSALRVVLLGFIAVIAAVIGLGWWLMN